MFCSIPIKGNFWLMTIIPTNETLNPHQQNIFQGGNHPERYFKENTYKDYIIIP
jgi:hypothetical protein